VAQLKAKVLDQQSQTPALLETRDDPVISPIPVTLQIKLCCDPFAEPGAYPHARCPWGAPACCPNGQWVCPSNGLTEPTKYICNGVEATGASLSSACIIKCCDPAKKPNVFGGSTFCLYGAHCCYTGQWVCGAQDGSYVCAGSKTTGITAYPCQNPPLPPAATCCDPKQEPGTNGNLPCLQGHQKCCLTGEWACPNQVNFYSCGGQWIPETGTFGSPCSVSPSGDGRGRTCGGIANIACPAGSTCVDNPNDSCDPNHGGPDCGGICQCNAAALIDTGSDGATDVRAVVPSRDRSTSEPQDNNVPVQASFLAQPDLPPAARCCDPSQEPGKNGNPICFEGYKCCITGEWACASGGGNSFLCGGQWTPSTGTFGFPCPELPPAAVCCDALKEPGKYGNSICPYGHQCCLTGEWSCADADGVTFTCDGKSTKEPGGFPCPPDCKEVQCPRLPCPDWQQYTPKDACCPACLLCSGNRTPLATTDCKLGKCPTGWSCEGKVVSDTSATGWHTVGLCCKDCSRALLCLRPNCPVWQQYIPEGECCPKCNLCHNGEAPWSSTTDCSTNGGRCPGGYACERNIHFDPNGDWSTYGLCCHPDCRRVLCVRLDCPTEQQIQPEGACCPFCKRATCLDGSTPMPGNCPTEQCPVGYSCNGFVDTPVPGGPWFSYGLCCKSG